MDKPIQIDYYTDMLCVWAWIAQLRVNELNDQWGSQIRLCHHHVDVFGDVPTKIATAWGERGGYQGYAEHVQQAVSGFPEVQLNPDVWNQVRPQSSATAHMVTKAVELSYGPDRAIAIEFSLRKAFFVGGMDISDLNLLLDLLEAEDLDIDQISEHIHNGAAMAALMGSYRKAKENNIKGSPTYVMDGGRQILFGNVGYRVISANIEELLRDPKDEASWC